jgi:hypothetical protein
MHSFRSQNKKKFYVKNIKASLCIFNKNQDQNERKIVESLLQLLSMLE